MKNENKIIDLLTEYIGKTDRMEREFMEEITFLRKEQLKLHKEHSKDMKQVNIRQEVLMKEIISLSRRVNDLKDRDN